MSRAKRYSPEHLEAISFSNLIKELDEKWSHTYVNVEYTEPEPTPLQILLEEGLEELQ
jgi:hypothetical protein